MIEPLLDQIYSQKELLIYLLGVFIVFIYVATMERSLKQLIRDEKAGIVVFLCLCSWIFIIAFILFCIFTKNENE